MLRAVAVVLGLVLAGCAAPRALSPEVATEAAVPLICEGPQQCADWWKRAQVWVARNAGYKIQVATDAVIETYRATSYSSGYAMRLTREPQGAQRERLGLSLSCGDAPLCQRYPAEVAVDFKRYVRGIQ